MTNIAKSCLRRVLTWAGIRKRATRYPEDFLPHEIENIAAARPYTMTNLSRMIALARALEHICANNIPGDIVECGVWKGGSMMLAARTLMTIGDCGRHLYLFDTFEGMPQPTDADVDVRGREATKTPWGHTIAGVEEVRRNVLETGYPSDAVHFIEGKVEDTLPVHAPQQIALLRLDTDWYESTYHELIHLYPLLSPGGILIIDDYGHWQGCRKAVDQFLAEQDLGLFLHRIDHTGRLVVKPRFEPERASTSS